MSSFPLVGSQETALWPPLLNLAGKNLKAKTAFSEMLAVFSPSKVEADPASSSPPSSVSMEIWMAVPTAEFPSNVTSPLLID